MDAKSLKQKLPHPFDQDLSKVLRGLNRRTLWGKRKAANDPVTAGYLLAACRIVQRQLGPGGHRTLTDPDDPDSVDRPLLSFLSQNAVSREMRRNPLPFPQVGKPSTLRSRWRHQSDFIADLLRFGLWSWHFPAPREAELTDVTDDILHGPDPIRAIHRLCYRDMLRHLETPMFRLSLVAAAEAEGDTAVREAIAERNLQNGALWQDFYEQFLSARGLKMRDGVTIEECVRLLSAIADGLALRALADADGVIDHQRRRSLLSLAAFAIIAGCVVPDGDSPALSLEDHIAHLLGVPQ